MISTALRAAVAAAAMLAATSAFAAGNLIANGDFSSPNLGGGWTEYSNLDGWTSLNDAIEVGYSPIYGLPCDNAGCQNLEVNANTWGEDVYTVTGLTPQSTYDLFWDYGGRASGGPDYLDVSFGGAVLTQDSGSVGYWTHNAFAVVAMSTSRPSSSRRWTRAAPAVGPRTATKSPMSR